MTDESVPVPAVEPLDDPRFAEEISPVEAPATWTYESDVVIVGGGGAGLCAAAAALRNGASVLVIERQATTGGHSQHGGAAASFNTAAARRKRSTPSARLHFVTPMRFRAMGRWTPACSPR